MLGSLLLILVVFGVPIQDGAAVRQSEADFARGVALQRQGDLQHAREAYEAALRSVPNRADALSNLGVIFARLGQYGEAIKYYKEALAVDEKQYDWPSANFPRSPSRNRIIIRLVCCWACAITSSTS